MLRCRNKRKTSLSGDTFVTSLIFLFILIGSLRLCFTTTNHESKLNAIFVQETQGFYLLENLMHLARDYAYQIVQNPREPHLFLSTSAYRTKDKLSFFNEEDGTYSDGWVIDFNGSLSKEQIVPNDFPLQIADDGWKIEGGPIFWQDNKKTANDERFLTEVFMLGSLSLDSKIRPDWTMRTVQTMEIERNPLCDFQLYAEGDIAINTNIHDDSWTMTIDGPVQINGNIRFAASNGYGNNNVTFSNKVNSAGYVLYVDGNDTLKNFKLPVKYHILDNSGNYKKTYGNGSNGFYFNRYAVNYGSTSTYRLSASYNNFLENVVTFSDMYLAGYNKNNYESYERCVFNLYRGNFTTRSRVYRPIGFDPINFWGFWEPSISSPILGSGTVTETDYEDKQVLNYCFGFHNLAQSSSNSGAHILPRDASEYCSAEKAIKNLRGIENPYQMVEKARLVEMQKSINFPSISLWLLTSTSNITNTNDKDEPSLYVSNNFIYSTYISNAFPASKDNIYRSRYLNLAFQNNSVITTTDFFHSTATETEYDYKSAKKVNDEEGYMHIEILDNKLAFQQIKNTDTTPWVSSSAKLKSTFPLTSYEDDGCPPDKLVDKTTYWTLDYYVTRVSGEHYNFMYDRNRAKWIQIVDIDVGQLKNDLENLDAWNNGNTMPIVNINTYWQGLDAAFTNKNYRLTNGTDIRYKYQENREKFFNKAINAEGSCVYPNDATHPPVIDIGVRLINAETLPAKGLTFYCPYPLYIKGNFNTTTYNGKHVPALIITDSLTLLHDNWQDWRSQMDPISSYLWYGQSKDSTTYAYRQHPYITGTKIYADIITGRTHPHFWINGQDTTALEPTPLDQTQDPNPDLGIHDAFRTLCDFNERIELHGSLMLPYFCQEQWEPPINFCEGLARNPSIYSYPNLVMHPREDVGIPAAMPFYYRIHHGRKTHCIGQNMYEALRGKIYVEDWSDKNFKTYHDALPNFLKYEIDI